LPKHLKEEKIKEAKDFMKVEDESIIDTTTIT
jgi:hypothetical protein